MLSSVFAGGGTAAIIIAVAYAVQEARGALADRRKAQAAARRDERQEGTASVVNAETANAVLTKTITYLEKRVDQLVEENEQLRAERLVDSEKVRDLQQQLVSVTQEVSMLRARYEAMGNG